MRFSSLFALTLAAAAGQAVSVVPVASAQTTPAPKHYSSSTTTIGDLLADPAARAILIKYVPAFGNEGGRLDQAKGMTLRELQEAIKAYAPEMLTDDILAAIDKDLAALPAK